MRRLSDGEFILGNYEKLLVKLPLFAEVREEDIPAMLLCLQAEYRSYQKGEVIFAEGDPAKWIGLVLSGEVQILQDDYFGRRTMIGLIPAGGIFGESFACARVRELPVTVLSSSDSTILLLNTDQIFHNPAFCQFHHILVENLLQLVASRNVFMNNRLCNTIHKTTRERILAYLMDQKRQKRSNTFDIPFDRQALADYLGVDRSALSQELSKLRKEGLLKTRKNHFELYTQDTRPF